MQSESCNSDVDDNSNPETDWDFPRSGTARSLHSIHPYPAKFISEIPAALIKKLGIAPKSILLDPFCGSGVTLVEAQRAGIESIGIDLNPIACLISRVKTSNLPKEFLSIAELVVISAKKNKKVTSREIPNVDHWFLPEVQAALHALIAEIEDLEPGNVQDALKLAFSSIVVRTSNQDSDTRYAAVLKHVSFDSVFKHFLNACRQFRVHLGEKGLPPKVIIFCTDSLKADSVLTNQKIGLVITSPPYPNAYEYWLYHKYRMWWLGLNPLAVKANEIGARSHFFKKNRHTASKFNEQMRALISAITPFTDITCKWGIVIGPSKIHGEVVDNGTIIVEEAEKLGWKLVERIEREILASRKAFNLSHARIKQESILVLEKVA